jgi:uncharacterized protein (DUF362 family)
MDLGLQQISSSRVAVTRLQKRNVDREHCVQAVERLLAYLNPAKPSAQGFESLIPPRSRVVIKPNFVTDRNRGPWGIEPLITSPVLIQTIVEQVLRTEAREVLVGDAPIQSCDFERLLSAIGLREWSAQLRARDSRFLGIADFRRTTCTETDELRVATENLQPLENFVLFDLGPDSVLEPISGRRNSFRVTRYDPREMAKTHGPGRHQYLVARQVLDADVVINMPKLKTHKKAGVTCALKNLVGINGNKEFLPHHRVGGSATGGDCYPGLHPVKRTLEFVLDRENSAGSSASARWWHKAGVQLQRILNLQGDEIGVEGAWSGNDTVWRMSLDLNRILLYGRSNGKMADHVQRRVIHVVDAIVAGQGDGPLAPQPLPLELLVAGGNAAAVDWVGAGLLGYEQRLVPIVNGAFTRFRWPLADFDSSQIELAGDMGRGPAAALVRPPQPVIHPSGWTAARQQQQEQLIECHDVLAKVANPRKAKATPRRVANSTNDLEDA